LIEAIRDLTGGAPMSSPHRPQVGANIFILLGHRSRGGQSYLPAREVLDLCDGVHLKANGGKLNIGAETVAHTSKNSFTKMQFAARLEALPSTVRKHI